MKAASYPHTAFERMARSESAAASAGRARLTSNTSLVPALVDQRLVLDPRHHAAQFFAHFLDLVGVIASRRVALNRRPAPARHSCIHSRGEFAGLDIIQDTRFISALVSSVMIRGPEMYSPHSAVLEIE